MNLGGVEFDMSDRAEVEPWLDYAEACVKDVHWHGNDPDMVADMKLNVEALKVILKNLPVKVTNFPKN